ncbi:hypothetical protein SUGI_0323970 [Cryptomeria japonica]|nr:hypothetical protein SUGI_0323970 [Cryptomeria japonica]
MRVWKQISIGNPILCESLNDVLKSRCIPLSNDEDGIFWSVAKSGEYSVKLGYEVQRQRGMCMDWPHKLCWSNKLLPKAGAFLWLALHNRILTGDRLKSIGISEPNMCVMCKADDESANHLLLKLPHGGGLLELVLRKYQSKNR